MIDGEFPLHYGQRMRLVVMRLVLVLAGLLLFPNICPAPWIYTPGEGWHYEWPGGEGAWRKRTAPQQLAIAQEAFDKKDYGVAAKAARRVVSTWPLSTNAPQAQYLLARSYEAKGQDERAFKAYQRLIEKYPKVDNYDEVVKRQFAIANRFLEGQWFKLWNVVPAFPSMDKTVGLYEKIIKNGPYSEVAPQAQLNIGQAHEKKLIADYPAAVKAYEAAADRYSDEKAGIDGLYKVGLTYTREARRAEYDQSIASQAIATFSDFATLYPDDPRVPETQKLSTGLKTEQARGSFDIARFYEKNHHWQAARIYYNDVLDKDPNSKFADIARQRIIGIKKREQ
jgi:outer membrane protein assembly factor BamD (BamD/ComL family)